MNKLVTTAQNIRSRAKQFGPTLAVGASALAFSGLAKADIDTDIATAFGSATTRLSTASGLMITMVAVLAGIGLLVSLLRK